MRRLVSPPCFWGYLFLLLLLSEANANDAGISAAMQQHQIIVANDSLSPYDIFWVNPQTLELIQMNEELVRHGTSHGFTAFVGHEFELQERPNGKNGQCRNKDMTCRRAWVSVTGNKEDHQVLVDRDFRVQKVQNAKPSNPHQPSKMRITNKSRYSVDMYYINAETKETKKITWEHPFPPGISANMETYTNHVFEIRQLGFCEFSDHSQCKSVKFKVPYHDAPNITITNQFRALWNDKEDVGVYDKERIQQSSFLRLFENCRQSTSPDDCVQSHLSRQILQTEEQLAFERSLREAIGEKLENYTCYDDSLESGTPFATEQWHHYHKARNVSIMLNRPASKIHLVHDFVSQEECDAMEKAASKRLKRGSVADGKGGIQLSDSRKAMQAGIVVPWDTENEGHPIAALSRRVYDYVNHVLDLGIEEHGQEALMSIQYKGEGRIESPDQYTPHCDGDCDGKPHRAGTRMATMIMYCKLPTSGGHTNFHHADVHVNPEKHMAVFFSYMDPKTKLMDHLLTEHSGCPVWEGEKKIITQWVRYGVSALDPHYTFNTNGVKKEDANW